LREDAREETACVGRKVVAVVGESVSVLVSASWNASFILAAAAAAAAW